MPRTEKFQLSCSSSGRVPVSAIASYGIVPVVGVPTEPLAPPIPHPRASIPVPNPALQNAVKERAPFRFLTCAVALDQLEHRILDHVHCLILVTRRNSGDPEGPSFDPARNRSNAWVRSSVSNLPPRQSLLGLTDVVTPIA